VRRVSVISSSSGAGKTTFARALAARLGVPCIELDALHWREPGWTAPPREVFRDRVSGATSGDAWVVDGNYSVTRDIVWSRADSVVWLDIPLPTALARIVRRTLARIRTREVLWGSNRETLRNAFFDRDSLIRFTLRTYRGRRARYERELARPEHRHLAVHRFRANADAERWLASL
jgi:adenylate kinase family enzyme